MTSCVIDEGQTEGSCRTSTRGCRIGASTRGCGVAVNFVALSAQGDIVRHCVTF